MKTAPSGKRIFLRKLTQKDATPEYRSWLNNPETTRFLDTKTATISSLKKYIKDKNQKPDCILFGIIDKKTYKHIGNIKLEPIDLSEKNTAVGLLIGDKNYWGKGIATEVMGLIVDYAFNTLRLKKLNLGVKASHLAAISVHIKLGFKIEKKDTQTNNLTMSLYNEKFQQ